MRRLDICVFLSVLWVVSLVHFSKITNADFIEYKNNVSSSVVLTYTLHRQIGFILVENANLSKYLPKNSILLEMVTVDICCARILH